jgi:hypothetical protein
MSDYHFWRDASGRLTFESFDIPADLYPAICGAIAAAFNLAPERELVTNGLDVLFQDYRRGDQVIGLAWDNWTGFTVCAKTTNSEALVQEIGACLLEGSWTSPT